MSRTSSWHLRHSASGVSALKVGVIAGILIATFASTKADPDLWGHIRFGLDVLASHTLPAVDPYSFTQDRPQLHHEWLGAVILAAVYSCAGSAGIVWMKLAIGFLTFGMFRRRLVDLRATDAWLIGTLVIWNIVPLFLTARPQLWTMLAILVLVRLLQDGRYLWIPVLFAIWANLHGGWVMGIGLLGTWSAATVADTWWRSRRIAWSMPALPVVAIVATLLTPYHWHLWRFAIETIGLSRSDIADWQPLFATWDVAQLPIAITVGLLIVVIWHRKTRPAWPWIVVCAVMLYGSFRVSRVAFVSMPAILLIILPSLAIWLPRPKRQSAPLPRGAVRIALASLIVAIVATGITVAPAFKCLPITGEWIPDPAAIPVLQSGVDGGRIVTFFDWGEYALWHLGPRLKVSMDGRRETIYSHRMLAIHDAIYDNTAEGSQWLMAERPEYVWLKMNHRGRRDWLAMHGYRIDWESDTSWVAVRDDLPRLSGPPTITSTGCFPGP